MPKPKDLAIVVLALALFIAAPSSATAASLWIDESLEGQDPIVTSDSPAFESATVTPLSSPETWQIVVTMRGDLVTLTADDRRGLELIDPATRRISDSFSLTSAITNGHTVFTYQFVSDDEAGNISDNAPLCGGPSSAICPEVLETGGFQLAILGTTLEDRDTSVRHTFDTYIKSDEGAGAAVPEPATLLLLTTGIVGAVSAAWRRSQHAK